MTAVLAFSPILGSMIAAGVTPLLVPTSNDIPTMHWALPIPSTITMILFIIFVRSSVPPTPPSKSAEIGLAKISLIKRYFVYRG